MSSGSESPLPVNPANGAASEDEWRHELSARLNRYRSRRKAPPPRYPSLRLPFGPAAPALNAILQEDVQVHSFVPETSTEPPHEANDFELSRPEPIPAAMAEPGTAQTRERNPHPSTSAGHSSSQLQREGHSQAGAKIIEFPRFAWGPPPPPADQLAEPVIDRPRILEVPEVTPPPPALGGITIESAQVDEPQNRPGIDTPLQSAILAQRVLALVVDGLMIAAASGLFGFIFWKVTEVRPPKIQLVSLAVGIPCAFWAVYQYLLVVYAGTTPGLRLARLQLSRFDGRPTSRSLRRWRVLASYLSAASLGMGYTWLFLDEDNLCWHDRITRTYLAPRKQESK